MRWSSLCARRTIRGFVVGLVTGIRDQELSFAGSFSMARVFGMYDGPPVYKTVDVTSVI